MSPPQISINRDATLDDLDTIVEFNIRMAEETEELQLPREIATTGVRQLLEDPAKGRYFIAEVEGRPVGQLMITYEWSDWRAGSIWWVQSVYVAPSHRRQGVYRRLYAHARAMAKQAGAPGVRLYTEHANEDAKRTYEALGMKSRYTMYEDMFTDY